ncbi:SUN domain-containing protein 1 Protein unc-84 -like protein A Sad1/unc-84 protein-like 1 [Channa argus]|uniref:SUN domain-containing protein 1 Protein unc-84-like protein A Sad1/unc-84 protein-like 1 n=1 Tax=Channa argus TaxID=215402 RepID=A0A6G1QNY4_CHAAH|nr:SUN domain-containing protein 1 Protein unc-84 -like protein A Sad1/unc-84 protein-like 1 [Channa argus]
MAYSSSYSYTVSDSEKEQQIVTLLQARTMSRRSLRLNDSLLDRSLPHSSASFSVGGGSSWRSSRSLRSRHSQQLSVSCSESLLAHTPRKQSGPLAHNSSLHSVASDASLLSSLLDESSIQETTMVDTLWGLDEENDPKESTIIADQSTVVADSTLTGSDECCPKYSVRTLNRVYCKDYESVSTHCSSSKYTPSSSSLLMGPEPLEHGETETSTIYCRDRSRKSRTDVLLSWLDFTVSCVRRAAACCMSALTHTWKVCRDLASKVREVNVQTDKHGARSRCCGVMNLKESTTNLKDLHVNGSLCKTAGEVFRWLSRCRTTNGGVLRLSPHRLFLVLLPLLLLLLTLCWFGPAGLQAVFPAFNVTDWRTVVHDVSGLSSIYSQSAEGAVQETKEVQPYVEPPYNQPPSTETPTAEQEAPAEVEEFARLVLLEQSVTALWERVEAGGQRADQRHRELLQLYADLQQQQQQLISAPRDGDGDGMKPWLRALLDQQLDQLRTQLDEEGRRREEIRQQDLLQQQSQTSRLDQLELQLQALAAKTESFQWRQETASTLRTSPTTLSAAVSVGVDRQSHDALLAEVARLEEALEEVRQDVEGLSAVQDGSHQLDRIQKMLSAQVSSQVREEVRVLLYGNQLTVGGRSSGEEAGLPESLLQWLQQQYVSGADLQAALASLELSILQNISLQLEQRHSEEMVREAVLNSAGAAVTQEDVHVIVKNALRLFSQDRTGLADYALESGGGSILSTRCSETYETKAALLSLFGLPLWYFSQSPRAVIQPDVHPGNCWAFKGSTGFLVIRLSMKILPTAFTLEHIPKVLTPSGTLHSAPRDFSIYGLDDESQERGSLLGTYTYDEGGEALQSFPVTEENDRAFQIIEVQVLSNWGHEEYTCIYRFRVHGTPSNA